MDSAAAPQIRGRPLITAKFIMFLLSLDTAPHRMAKTFVRFYF